MVLSLRSDCSTPDAVTLARLLLPRAKGEEVGSVARRSDAVEEHREVAEVEVGFHLACAVHQGSEGELEKDDVRRVEVGAQMALMARAVD